MPEGAGNEPMRLLRSSYTNRCTLIGQEGTALCFDFLSLREALKWLEFSPTIAIPKAWK